MDLLRPTCRVGRLLWSGPVRIELKTHNCYQDGILATPTTEKVLIYRIYNLGISVAPRFWREFCHQEYHNQSANQWNKNNENTPMARRSMGIGIVYIRDASQKKRLWIKPNQAAETNCAKSAHRAHKDCDERKPKKAKIRG